MIENDWDESRCEDMGGCKVRGLDDGLACMGFEDKLRERRAKMIISSDSDALLVILSGIDDTYRTWTRVASLRF